MTKLSEEDVGKLVVDTVGRELGVVTEIVQNTAYIDPDPNPLAKLRIRLGRGTAGPNARPLYEDRITRVTGDAIRVTDAPRAN